MTRHVSAESTALCSFLSRSHTLMLLVKTPFLLEMALRLYTGSRDIPKDVEKAAKFLALAREKATTDEEHREAEYYEILITRLKAKEEGRTHSHTHPIRQRGALLGFELNYSFYDTKPWGIPAAATSKIQ